jgi:hypothetical protein
MQYKITGTNAYMVHKCGFVCATSGVSCGVGLQRMTVSRVAHATACYLAQST